MTSGLIGHSGFVGGSLLRQRSFARCYRSTDIDALRGHAFDLLVCAGAPGQKWKANLEPEADLASIESLMHALAEVRARQFVLISTVDVFLDPCGVDERTKVVLEGLHAYGRHRFALEYFVRERFPHALIVRLPGLVGPGLRKNVIFDLHNDNNLARVDSRARFQFYPMVNLWNDLAAALTQTPRLLHLTAEPLDVASIAAECFGRVFANELADVPPRYDFRSCIAASGYQYDCSASLLAIRAYAQSEPRSALPTP